MLFFIQLPKTKCGYERKCKGLSCSRLRELVLESFKDIVPDISAIGRIALVVAELLLPQMLAYQTDIFTRHGRGASESATDGYVQDSLSSRLSVSNALDI